MKTICAPSSRHVEASKASARPFVPAHSELHDEVVFGDDEEFLPGKLLELGTLGLEPLAGSVEPRRPAGSQRVVHHVRATQLAELAKLSGVKEGVEARHDRLVGLDTHLAASIFVILKLLP
jgi:hypothetical protein